jgi:hypothetical protein
MGRFLAKHFITARRAPIAVTVRVSWDIGLFLLVVNTYRNYYMIWAFIGQPCLWAVFVPNQDPIS